MIERSLGESARRAFRIRPMFKLGFTEAEKLVRHYERYPHPHPWVRPKMEVLWLKSQGLPHREIARLAGVSENTLCSPLQESVQGGLARLRAVRFHRPQSELASQRASLERYFRAHSPATVNEARAKRAEVTGITRSPTPVRAFMSRVSKKSWSLASPRRGRFSSPTPLTLSSGPYGVLPGSGSKRPAGAAASMAWAPSMR